jgi:hypothetical protein
MAAIVESAIAINIFGSNAEELARATPTTNKRDRSQPRLRSGSCAGASLGLSGFSALASIQRTRGPVAVKWGRAFRSKFISPNENLTTIATLSAPSFMAPFSRFVAALQIVAFLRSRLLDDARAFAQLDLLIGMLLCRGAKNGSRDRDVGRVGQYPLGPVFGSPDSNPESKFVLPLLGLPTGVKRRRRRLGGVERRRGARFACKVRRRQAFEKVRLCPCRLLHRLTNFLADRMRKTLRRRGGASFPRTIGVWRRSTVEALLLLRIGAAFVPLRQRPSHAFPSAFVLSRIASLGG